MDALLALEDGRVFRGRGLGAAGVVTGEVVFNTGLTGYQEIVTDPSYRGQIVTLTVPHVGNTGVNPEDPESDRPQVAGLVVRAASRSSSSWRAQSELDRYLRRHAVPGLEGIDTRALTRHIRSAGVLRGCLSTGSLAPEQAVERARQAPRIETLDLVGEVTCRRAYSWREAGGPLIEARPSRRASGYHVVAFDFGIKRNILRLLAARGFRITVVPAGTSAADALALRPDGIFLSNGPGDPEACAGPTATIRALVGRIPIFGICLGHQLIARALGARTFKLKFGHRGTNHPVREQATGRVAITSQNHGYAVDPDTLPAELEVTHVSLYDGTVEGLAHREVPLFSVQFHPEGAPGPHDTWDLFDRFVELIESGSPLPAAAPPRSA
ncbi:MAG: carbamoyl-phosphate synthase small subunit [Acidobacteria bacterium]|nr:MAG: carbamoyl-phosphate synthase small subunit [Acidobacteriota bacterium]